MYSGLLPSGLTEDDLSPDDEEDKPGDLEDEKRQFEKGSAKNTCSLEESQPTHTADSDSPTCSMPGISQEMWQVCCIDLIFHSRYRLTSLFLVMPV